MKSTLELKLADAIRATESARSQVELMIHRLSLARLDVSDTRRALARRRNEEAAVRRELRAAERSRAGKEK
jgi:hypothetical protein